MLRATSMLTGTCSARQWRLLARSSRHGISTLRFLSTIVRNHIHDSHPRLSSPGPSSTYTVKGPRLAQDIHQVERSTSEDIKRAIVTSHGAQPSWSSSPISHRSRIVLRASELIKDRQSGWYDRLVDSDRSETSVSNFWVHQQLNDVVGFLDTLANVAEDTLAPSLRVEGNHNVHTTHEPFGVCLAIAAWNAVHLLTSRAIITPLLAGNTVILKTSEYAPRTQLLWAELLFEAGLPKDCLSVLHASKEDSQWVVPELIADDRIRHVNFTGSSTTGSIIASLAGKHLKPSIMELGGKAPALILPDADLDLAANHILFGAWMNAGQICMSTERILVPQSKYDDLVVSLRKAWTAVKGTPVSVSKHLCDVGGVKKVQDLIGDAEAKGAKPILDGHVSESDQWSVSPNIYGPIDQSMRLYSEESFGPICAIIPVPEGVDEQSTVNQMVEIANSSSYGLSASIWSGNVDKATNEARRIQSGAVHINGPTCFDAPLTPHGGWKHSGWGRFNGPEGLLGFTQLRCITTPREPPHPLPLELLIP